MSNNQPSRRQIWGLALSVVFFTLAVLSINEIISADNLWGVLFLTLGTVMWLYLGSGVLLVVLRETLHDILSSHKNTPAS